MQDDVQTRPSRCAPGYADKLFASSPPQAAQASLAHVIDMHQLTKDPELVLTPYVATPSSPSRELDRFALARYLDYCSELLAITSKLAVLYLEYLDDARVLSAVNDIQSLCNGLSNKIWQKIMILDTRALHGGADAPRPQA